MNTSDIFMNRVKSIIAGSIIATLKHDQKATFSRLGHQCTEHYRALKEHDLQQFILPAWAQKIKNLESVLLPEPDFSFIHHQLIQSTMCVQDTDRVFHEELHYCKTHYKSPGKLRSILLEELVGGSHVTDIRYLTSPTRVHHLYHLMRFENSTSCDLRQTNDIVEWGGGYGDMAALIRKMTPSATYTIIDIPLLSCIQWLYLSSIFGPEAVNFITSQDLCIKDHKINLLPLCFLEINKIDSQIFIATWSLSESSAYSIDYVLAEDYFHADHLLLAYQESNENFPSADIIGEKALNNGARIEPITLFPGNYYAFK